MTTNTAAKNTSNNSGRVLANNRMRRIQSSREATTSSSFPSSSSFIHSRGRRRMVSSPCIPRGAATMRIGEGSEREKSKRRRGMDVAATATSNETNASSNNNNGGYAWRGDPIPTKSLPLLPNGKVDYSSIDKSPISKVLTSTIRKLLVQEVGKDTDPRDHANFEALMTSVREVNDMKGTRKTCKRERRGCLKGYCRRCTSGGFRRCGRSLSIQTRRNG